jgi:hypothetical protein
VLAALILAIAAAAAPATDVFVTSHRAALRDAPSPSARVVERLPLGTRAALVSTERGWLRVSVERGGISSLGWVSRDVAATLEAEDARAMGAVGRFLASDPERRPLAFALLSRASETARRCGAVDAATEVALGETAESLEEPGAEASFLRTLECGNASPSLTDRATAGLLRARYRTPSNGLVGLLGETPAWLALTGSADPGVASLALERGRASALALGRLLLAVGRPDELASLRRRIAECAMRLEDSRRRRLESASLVLDAMAGNGAPPFPQEARWGAGPLPMRVAIEGALGELALRLYPAGRQPPRTLATPVLPVPGSLRIAPDGRVAAWLEVSGPSTIAPVLARLDGSLQGDAALLAGGRPLRDRKRKHVVASLLGFSKDGRRLSIAVRAWDDEPPERERRAAVSTANAALLEEGPEKPPVIERARGEASGRGPHLPARGGTAEGGGR